MYTRIYISRPEYHSIIYVDYRPEYHSNRLIYIYINNDNGDTIYTMYVYYINRIASFWYHMVNVRDLGESRTYSVYNIEIGRFG